MHVLACSPCEKVVQRYKIILKSPNFFIENDKNLSPLFLPIPYNKFDYYLRYCPCCVKEDREHFGEAFFHVEHQIVELHCCPIHGVKLIDTKIVNSKAHDATFVPLEMVVESLEEIEANEIEKKLSNYIFESLKIDLDLTNEYQIGSFLVDRLNDSYLSPRGEQKDLNKIMKDMMAFYVNYKYININKKRVATIYRNEYLNVFNIFLIAFFEKIPVKDLCEFKQTKMTRWEAFDEIVKKYYKDGKNYNQIAFLMGVNKEVIRQVIIGTYDKPKKTNSRYKCQRWNWEAIDNECCLKFEKVVLEALEKDKSLVLGRKLVASLFGLKDHTLRNLPKLKKMIKKYKKSE